SATVSSVMETRFSRSSGEFTCSLINSDLPTITRSGAGLLDCGCGRWFSDTVAPVAGALLCGVAMVVEAGCSWAWAVTMAIMQHGSIRHRERAIAGVFLFSLPREPVCMSSVLNWSVRCSVRQTWFLLFSCLCKPQPKMCQAWERPVHAALNVLLHASQPARQPPAFQKRSEERRVGKECR